MSRARGFTLVEMLIVLGIIGVLAAVLFPVANGVRARARIATCTSNLRQIHLAREMYQQDYDGNVPSGLHNLFPRYLNDKRLLTCPNDTLLERGGYEWVGFQSQGIAPKNGRLPQSYPYTRMFESEMFQSSDFDQYLPPGVTRANKQQVLQAAGYATCQLHGDFIRTSPTSPNGEEFPTVYKGLTLRLCLDGSVRQVQQPRSSDLVAFFYGS